ncbi:MAG: ABC transporter permease [Propionicimonas sp.]|uniref:ABC transporter permease n=1 Tax=Propionicimonas sp. TaxID=1955623 RepID=UPI003D0D24A3
MNSTVRWTLTRLGGIVLVLLIVTMVTFAVFYILPADPAQLSCGKPCTPDHLAQARSVMGYDQPIWEQYLRYLGGIFTGRTFGSGGAAIHCPAPCLGWSFTQQRTVTSLIAQTLPVTASIAVGAAVLWFIVGVSAGVVAALRRGTVVDRVVMTVAIVGVSTPAYLVGLLAILLFGFILNVVPVSGYVPFATSPAQWAFHLVTPWCVLAFISAAMYARITRGQMLDVLGDDYVRTARAKGLGEARVIGRHALRNALIPVVTMFGLDLGGLLGGAVITEKVFSMYGMGALLIDSVSHTDLPVITGITIVSAAFIGIANLVVDLTYKALDPRA